MSVENTKGLYAAMEKQLDGEIIEDYNCGGCNKKVSLQRRSLLGKTPNVMIVHLQRIIFDFDTFRNKKVNSKFEFPRIIDLSRYSLKENVDRSKPLMGDSDRETAELNGLLDQEDDDYVYRLVGVNIHRGVADSGHYWSMINTVRGEDEPDALQKPAEWLSSNEKKWRKFDDDHVSNYDLDMLDKESFGGDSSALTENE